MSQSVPKDGRFSTLSVRWQHETRAYVSIRPEGRQVQHHASEAHEQPASQVSIRPEGRQVQHQRQAEGVTQELQVSIRPEGRQVQHLDIDPIDVVL